MSSWLGIRDQLAARADLFDDPDDVARMARAAVYVWTASAWDEMRRTRAPEALEASPPEAESEAEWWAFDRFVYGLGFGLAGTTGLDPGSKIAGVLRAPTPPGWTVSLVVFPPGDDVADPRILGLSSAAPGETLRRGSIGYWLELGTVWRNTTAAHVRAPAPGSNAQRRRGVKPDDPKRVHVVTLRTLEYDAAESSRGSVAWAARWRVRPYLQVRSGRLVAVAGHVKGPPDKPIAATIYRVAR